VLGRGAKGRATKKNVVSKPKRNPKKFRERKKRYKERTNRRKTEKTRQRGSMVNIVTKGCGKAGGGGEAIRGFGG